MKYTERDIEKAIRLRSEGYNWIATNKNGRPFAFGRIPYRCSDDDSNEYNIWDDQPGTPWLMLSKEYFKSITWENEPVYIDEIITGGKVQDNGDTVIDRLTAENQRLKEEVTEQESIAAYEHAMQMEWFSIAGDYKAENAALRKRLENAVEFPRLEISPYDDNDTLLYYLENGHIQQECFNNKYPEQLQKRLEEIKGDNQ